MGKANSIVRSADGGTGQALADMRTRALAEVDRIDFSQSASFLRRRLSLIVAMMVVALVAGVGMTLLSPRIYRAEATVMLAGSADADKPANAGSAARSEMSSELVNTQLEILTSRDMALRVAQALGLTRGLGAQETNELIGELTNQFAVKRSGDSFALELSYDSSEPKAAIARVNEYARQFTQWEMSVERQRSAEARQRLQGKIAELRKQAQTDLQALQQYRIANNLLSTSGASLAEQEISNYDQQVSQARVEAASDNARLETALAQLRSGSTGDDVGEALNSSVIASLRPQETKVAADVADMSARYGANHPALIRARSQLAEIREQIQAEIGRQISNLRAKQEVSNQRLATLGASLSAAQGKLSQNNSAMVGLSEYERAAEASNGIYETYLSSYKQLLAAEGSEKPNARILTLAEAPLQQRSPNLALNVTLALVLGLGLGVVVAYFADAVFQGISTPDEIERELGETYLASIPLLESIAPGGQALTAAQNPRSPFSEALRSLGNSVDHATDNQAQVIAISSALPGEGKSVISCCLASVLAADGLRTILIDCDIRRRGVSRLLKLPAEQKGLTEILRGTAPLDLEHMNPDAALCFIPLPPSDDEPIALLRGPKFVALLEALRTKFDRIILDLPPVLPMAITPVLASRADAVVLAAHWRKTPTHAIRAALRRLPQEHVNVVGVALSQIDLRQRAYSSKNDPIFYYKKYQRYYQ